MAVRGVRIVLDEEKILREGKYKLDELYAYLDEIAKEADLSKLDKYTYVGKGDKEDFSRVGIFCITEVVENESITKNLKEWYWLDDGVICGNIINEPQAKNPRFKFRHTLPFVDTSAFFKSLSMTNLGRCLLNLGLP